MGAFPPRLPASILIANRGEVAIRIARTCRSLGIRSIGIHSAVDRGSLHVGACDRAVALSGEAPSDGYLDAEQIIAIARAEGAEAIHPGYGFLSENAGFARACREAGIAFVGPSAEVIEALGDKIAAKRIAADAGVPIVPGIADDDMARDRDAALLAAAAALPFPLLVKASAGGGGRGMRIVRSPEDLAAVVALARREALASFGDDRLLIERYIESPRHVEVQIFGDRHGNAVHLHERDCSVQRRHQKLLEEAPAPALPGELRGALHGAALSIARATGYDNAGTVEFVLDAEKGAFFFLEVNTRLQVEHPVTEAILGLDLVEWQIRVAAGEPLPLRQEEIVPSGWAIEARLVAEDPDAGFSPQTGRIAHVAAPSGPGVRLDTGVARGSDVTPHYDSMLSKVIAHGPDRDSAIRRLDAALAAYSVMGVGTNKGFLRAVLCDDSFLSGTHTTHVAGGIARRPRDPSHDLAAALIVACKDRTKADGASPWRSLGAWRGAAHAAGQARMPCVLFDEDEGRHAFLVRLSPGEAVAEPVGSEDGTPVAVGFRLTGSRLAIRRDGRERGWITHVGTDAFGARRVHVDGGEGARAFRIAEGLDAWRRPADDPAASGDAAVRAPGPGLIASIAVKPGDAVETGAPLVVVEAMKMLQTLTAPRAGRIASVRCAAGQSVAKGDVLVELFDEDPREA